MYLVVSKWEIPSADEEMFLGAGKVMREWLRQQPGVEYAESIRTEDGNGLALIGYRDEETYKRIVQGPDSPFEQKAREMKLDQIGKWLWSERGETVDQAVTG